MKFLILRDHLKNGLDIINKIGFDSSSNLPILKNFLIETFDNKIKLTATNLELAITGFVPAKIIENGGLTIPLNIFNSIISNIESERINLEVIENNLLIKTDNYQAKIQSIKKEEYPIIPQINNNFSLEISSSILKNSLISVINAATINSEIKPELNGILFDFQINNLKLAATDSFRLAEKIINNNEFKSEIDKKFKLIIPIKTIQEVIRILKNDSDEKINIYFDNNQVLFKSENIEIISRLINGDFPDYNQIIPQSIETEVVINKNQLIQGLKLTGSFTDRLNEVKIIIKENSKNIEIYSSNQNLGENQYLIPAKLKGPSVEVVFNWRFILDGLKSLDSNNSNNIILGINGDSKPAMIKLTDDISYLYILMPIKNH